MKKTIVILVANFEFEEFKEIPKGHTKWKIREEKFLKYVLTDVFELHILELPKLERMKENSRLDHKEETLAKWVKFLLTPNEIKEVDMENNESLKKAKEEWDDLQKDEYEQRMAESRMIHLMDIQSIEETGYEKGLEAGLQQGIEQGEKENAKKIAMKMLMKDETVERIIELTELTREEIEELRKKMEKSLSKH